MEPGSVAEKLPHTQGCLLNSSVMKIRNILFWTPIFFSNMWFPIGVSCIKILNVHTCLDVPWRSKILKKLLGIHLQHQELCLDCENKDDEFRMKSRRCVHLWITYCSQLFPNCPDCWWISQPCSAQTICFGSDRARQTMLITAEPFPTNAYVLWGKKKPYVKRESTCLSFCLIQHLLPGFQKLLVARILTE